MEFYRRRSDKEQLIQVNVNERIEEVTDLPALAGETFHTRRNLRQVQRELEPDLPLL